MASTAKSALPRARAARPCRRSAASPCRGARRRPAAAATATSGSHFAPSQRSPTLLPLQPSRRERVLRHDRRRACGHARSREKRPDVAVDAVDDDEGSEISARSLHAEAERHRPVARRRVKPWLSSKLTRYALTDHLRAGSTSAVGTFQRPGVTHERRRRGACIRRPLTPPSWRSASAVVRPGVCGGGRRASATNPNGPAICRMKPRSGRGTL